MLVGDDFRFGARRTGDYATLEAAGKQMGFEVARMNSYEVHGRRVSCAGVRAALATGDMAAAAALLGRPYTISGHVVHGRKLGQELGFRTLNLPFRHQHPAAHGTFAVRVLGLSDLELTRFRGRSILLKEGARHATNSPALSGGVFASR